MVWAHASCCCTSGMLLQRYCRQLHKSRFTACRFQLKKVAYSQAGSASPAGAASPQASRPSTASSVEGQQVRATGRTMPSAGMAAQVSPVPIGCLERQNVLAQARDSSLSGGASGPDSRLACWRCSGQWSQRRRTMPCGDAKELPIKDLRRLGFAFRAAASLAWHPSAECPLPPACTGRSASQAHHQMLL